MACRNTAITNENISKLEEKIQEIEGREDVDNLLAYFRTSSFLEDFGDYVTAWKEGTIEDFGGRVDDNGEPLLIYNETAKKYYYIDKVGERVYFPLTNRGLRGVFNYKKLDAITSQMALGYFQANTKNDFNNLDFTDAKDLPSLKPFLKQKLESKIDELSKGTFAQKINAKLLTKTLDHLDEWVEKVDSFYKKIGLNRKDNIESDENELEEIEEEGKDPIYNKASFERDMKESVSTNVKLRLSLLKDETNIDPVWGEPSFIRFDETYSTILQKLAGQVAITKDGVMEDIFEIYKDELQKIVVKKPYFQSLINYLNDESFTEDNENEFTQAFNLHKNNFLVSEISKQNDKFVHGTKGVSDSGSKASIVLAQWGNNFKNQFLDETNNLTTDGLVKINDISKRLGILKAIAVDKTVDAEEEFEDNVIEFVELLNELGVETTNNGFNYYLEDEGVNEFDFNKQSSKLVTTIVNTLISVKRIQTAVKSEKSEEDYKNPFADQTIFKSIAKAESFYMSEGSDSSIFTGGKSKWLYSYPSYLSTKVLGWKKDRNLLLESYNKSAYTKGSELMKWLLAIEKPYTDVETESLKRIKNFDLGVFTTFQESAKVDKTGKSEGSNSLDASKISQNDYFIDHVNKVLNNDYSRTTTPADKTTDIQIKSGMMIQSFDSILGETVKVSEKAQKIFLGYFASEFDRMREALHELEAFKNQPEKLKVHYHFKKGRSPYNEDGSINPANLGNAFKSQYFHELSVDSDTKDPLALLIKELLYDKKGLPKVYDNHSLLTGIEGIAQGGNIIIKDILTDYIIQELGKGIKESAKLLRDYEIIGYNADGVTVNKLIDHKLFAEKYKGNLGVAAMISDYYINSVIQNIEYSKMFTGDVAFYKDMVDYKKRVPATYTDGLQLRLKPGEENFNIASIESIEIPSPFIKKLEEMLGVEGAKPYRNINAADAQAWITPERWKFLVKRLGKWSATHDKLYAKMISDTNETYTEKELKIAAQPLKGVYFELNDKTPVYLKYSQAVLTKRLVEGTPLEKIYNKMTQDENGKTLDYNDQIHEVITLDGVKVGSPTTTKIHNGDGSIKDKFDLNVISLKNSGWKLQQDLPTKTFKETEVGSQIQKNIFGGLLNNREATFILDGEERTGQDIINELVKVTKSLSDEGLKSLKTEFGINEFGKIEKTDKFYNSLIDELTKRGGSKNVIDALRKEIALYGIPQASSKIINVFSSIVTKRTVKIKTNGGSFVQMSNFGMNYEKGVKQGVLWAPDALHTTNEPELYVDKNGRKRIKPAGVLISGSFIAKYVDDYTKYSPEQLFGTINEETGEREGGLIDSKITEQLIGYRIPNQGLASNDALRIVGILPEENGDTVVAYTGITTKTGSDFDIDKMYIMFPSFNHNEETGRLEYVDSKGKSKKALQNRLIELYQSVLTHPEVIKDVMRPVDIDFIKNDINDLLPLIQGGSLSHFDAHKDIQLLYDFRRGKTGVGQEANAVVDINRDGQLVLNKYFIHGGHSLSDLEDETLLDNEYSKPLSKKDLDYYLSQFPEKQRDDIKAEILKPRVADSLTAVLNGFVDIAKDPFITRGNWVTATTNVGNLMLRAGVHPLYVTSFLAQPILRDYIAYQNSLESLINNDGGDMELKFKKNLVYKNLDEISKKEFPQLKRPLSQVYDKFVNKKSSDLKALDASNIRSKIYTFLGKPSSEEVTNDDYNKMIKIIKDEHSKVFTEEVESLDNKSLKDFRDQIKSKETFEFQTAVLKKFKELQEVSKNVRENVMVSKVDTSGNGKNINSLFATANLKQHILNKERLDIVGAVKGFQSKFDHTVLGTYYHNSIIEIMNIVDRNPKLFPQGQRDVQDMFNKVSEDLYGTPAIQEDMMTKLEDEFRSYTMAKFFNLKKERSNSLIHELPNEFETFRKEHRGKYLIIDELQIKNKKGIVEKFLGLNNRKKSPDFEETFTDSWRDLKQDFPDFAEKLIEYSYVTSGFKTNPNQFFTYIPHEYFVEKNFNEFIRRNALTEADDFLDKFYLNNSKDAKYVYREVIKNITTVETIVPNPKYKDVSIPSIENGFIMTVPGRSRRFISISGGVYKLEGYNEDRQGIYTRTLPLGHEIEGSQVVEYGEPFLVSEKILNIKPGSIEMFKKMVDNRITSRLERPSFELEEEDGDQHPEFSFDVVTEDVDFEDTEFDNNLRVEEFEGFWKRENIAKQTDKVFLFGDNTADRLVTKHIPTSTQAVIRGLPNAIGIDTKRNRRTNNDSYFSDENFEEFKFYVDKAIQDAKDSGKTIVIPKDGIGTGKAMLKEKAPKLFQYLEQELNKLKQVSVTPKIAKQLDLFNDSHTIESLYDQYKKALIAKHGKDFKIEHLKQLELELGGIDYLIDYLKKC